MSRGKLSPGRSSNTRSQEENRSRNKNTWKSRKLGSSSKAWIREGKRNARKEENEELHKEQGKPSKRSEFGIVMEELLR